MSASRRSFATACCNVAALLAAGCATAACSRPSSATTITTTTDTATLVPSTLAPAASSPALVVDAATAAALADAGALGSGPIVKAKSLGHTSFVLKLTFASGESAGWKPRSRLPLGDRRYRGEIAASRLAEALGLSNVPHVEPRSFAASALRAVLPDFDDKALPDDDGRVRGAMWAWNPHYEIVPLELPSSRARWEPWLTDAHATIPPDQRELARALSTLLLFDYVTGNWDRWSGGNVARDSEAGTLLYVDNDGAFYDPPPADSLASQLARLKRVVRFSRGFVDRLRALDEAKLRAVFGDETPGAALLPDRVIAGVEQRRRTALDVVDRRAKLAGDAGVTFDFD
jgi:hypothetical protein